MARVLWFLLVFGIVRNALGQGDSLRSALNVMDRRQRNLEDYDENEYGYTLERPEDIAFLKAPPEYGPDRSYDRIYSNYLNDNKYESEVNKRLSSSFRERMAEEDNQKQKEEMAQNMFASMDSKGRYEVESEDYDELLRELYDKYRRNYEKPRMYSSRVDKRYMYPRFGLDGAGLRKRTAYANDLYDDENYDDENDEEYPSNYLRKRYYQRDNKINRLMRMYSNSHDHSKRFPVTKRSSDFKGTTHEHKRSTTKKQTDPKVEKELSNIFASAKGETTTTKPSILNQTATDKNKPVNKTEVAADAKDDGKVKSINKEQFTPVAPVSTEPLQLKKKSVDWSDYFGLDRRKKSSEPSDLDKEWLIERYHKSIQLSKKRTAELPLSSFRNHDEPLRKETGRKDAEDERLEEMDSKLQLMENKIVDDTLKYTGSHQGDNDPKEVQEIKDRVISRLAAAYSLEKMRNALGEYRRAIAKEKEGLKNRRPEPEGEFFSEEKRTAVPRKQVVDKDREDATEADNSIKCADGNEDCHEQNYKTPSDVIESHFGVEECAPIERACNEVASIVGEYGHVFEKACSMHEMCLLCSNNSWFSPTRQCNSLFLAKAYDMCKGNLECQKEAQRSVRYLLEVNRSLHTDPSALNDCELSCPETENMLDTNSR